MSITDEPRTELRHLEPDPGNDPRTVSIVAVVIACVAMFAAVVSAGYAINAVHKSDQRLAEIRSLTTTAPIRSGSTTAAATLAATPTVLGVTEHDFAITPSAPSAPAGLIDLNVTNNGPSGHELLIFQTDLAPDKLPLGPDGRVDEEGAGVTKVFDSGNNIDPGTTKTFHTALVAGNYVLVCNLPGHYQAGMHTAFTVTPSNAPVTAVGVTEHDFAITPSPTSVPGGLIDLNVTNNGPSGHELLIFQTDLSPDKFPMTADGRVDEAGDGITKVFDSGDNIDPGTTKTFHTALPPGNYVMVCNLPGHFNAGMHTAFTVS